MNIVSSSRRTRRGSTVVSPEEFRSVAVLGLFRKYREYPPFRDALTTLADGQRQAAADLMPLRGHDFAAVEARATRSAVLASYVDAVRAVAERWGLDRVDGSTGVDAIHRWVDLRFQDPHEDGGSFGFGLAYDSPVPDVDLMVHVKDGLVWDPEDEPRADYRKPPSELVLKGLRAIRGDNAYIPYIYSTGVRTELAKVLSPEQEADLDAELDRIQSEYEVAGWVFRDAESALNNHLQWTFERLALRRAVMDIADVAVVASNRKPSEKYVRDRIDKMKKRLGIDRFPTAHRKPYRSLRG